MKDTRKLGQRCGWFLLSGAVLALSLIGPLPEAWSQNPSSYAPVKIDETFETIKMRMMSAKAEVMNRQMSLLSRRYDMSDRAAQGVTMSRGKAIQQGVRVKLPRGMTWEKLDRLTPKRRSASKDFSPRDSCRCRIRTIPKEACSFRSTTLRRSIARKDAT